MNTTNCDSYPTFLDCEASSLNEKSFPIEIAWNNADGTIESYLINIYRYPNGFDGWNRESQSIHGITKQYLSQKGEEPEFVVKKMEKKLRGKKILTDEPERDELWIRRLYESVNIKCELDFYHANWFFNFLDPNHHTYLSKARKVIGYAHCAVNDVKYLHDKYRLCIKKK